MRLYDDPDFRSPPPEMDALFRAAADDSFFSTPGWYDLVARYGAEPDWRPRLYASDNGMAGLVCGIRHSHQAIQSFTNMLSTEYDALSGFSGGEVLRYLARDVANQRPHFPYIRLDGLDPLRKSFDALLAGFRDANFVVKPFLGWGVWHEPVAGHSFADYLARRPSILRNTWKRKLAAAGKSANISLRIVQPSTELEQFIGNYDAVQATSWKKPEPFPNFIPQLIRYAAGCGALEAGILEIDNRPAAAQFWIVWRGRATIFKLAYSKDYRDFSPGTLLTMHMVRHVLEKHTLAEINFGRGDDDYKKLWVSERRERWGIEAANLRTLRGLAIGARIAATAGRDILTGRKFVRRNWD
jgi:hypothetical protein